jgi:hypothetical protein
MSWRVLLVSAALIPLNALWMMTGSLWNAGYPTTVSLFFNTILYLFVLTTANFGVKAVSPRLALPPRDLLVIYTMVTLASAISGLDMLQLIGAMVAGPHALATPENQWSELFLGLIPSWLVVSDPVALTEYVEGETSLYRPSVLATWVWPVLAWSAFTLCLLLMMVGLSLVVGRRWNREERLAYPIIQLPLEMVEGRFYRNGAMWTGFAIGALLALTNGLHFFYPAVPTLGRPVDMGRYITSKPWNAIGWLPLAVQPFCVGLSFLVPLELSFSGWFFYFVWKMERVAASALGIRMSGFPFVEQQTTGAYAGFAVVVLWAARRQIRAAFGELGQIGRRGSGGLGMALLLVGCAGVTLFCLRAGMGLWSVVIFFGLYTLITVSVGRMRAELGSPVHDLHFAGPAGTMVSVLGSRAFKPVELTVASLFWFFNRAYRSHPMPCVLEGFRLSERSGTATRRMVGYTLVAAALGVAAAFWAHLHSAYAHGAGTRVWPAYETFRRLSVWLVTPTGAEARYGIAFTVGAAVVWILSALRMRYVWFALHPVGYVVSSSWAMNPFWFSIFIGWGIKLVIVRAGGLRAYQRSIPLFLGMILGEFLVDGGFSLAGTLLQVRTYIWYG